VIRAAHGAGEVVDGQPLPAIYDSYLRHSAPTPHVVSREQRAAATKTRKAIRKSAPRQSRSPLNPDPRNDFAHAANRGRSQ
jgi:hypothetical protein